MNNKLSLGLLLAILFQVFVLGGMYVKAALPLWLGQEIKVNTIPVDPRSLFRGNYARLNYDFSRIDTDKIQGDGILRNGEVIFVKLVKSQNGIYQASTASLQKPSEGHFIRGRVEARYLSPDEPEYYRVNYGIEAFFAPKERAIALEKELADGGTAVLMVDTRGAARIKDVEVK